MAEKVDMIGFRSGKLTVIAPDKNKKQYWLCRCDCNETKVVRGYELRANKVTMCDKCRKEQTPSKSKIDLSGETIGYWKVNFYNKNKSYNCTCLRCNKEFNVLTSNLKRLKEKMEKDNTKVLGGCEDCYRKSLKDKQDKLNGTIINGSKILNYLGDGIYECTCSICGKALRMNMTTLKQKEVVRCEECYHKSQVDDISEQTFGNWKAIKYIGYQMWEVQCLKCGKTYERSGYNLRSLHTTQCNNCKMKETFKDLKEQKFNEFTAKEYVGNGMWLCKCSCGNLRTISGTELLSGKRKSCGCKKIEYTKKSMIKKYGEICGARKNNCRDLNLINAISSKENLEKFIKENFQFKPATATLAKALDISVSTLLRKVHKFELENMVEIGYSSKLEDDIHKLISAENPDLMIDRHNKKILGNGQEIDIYIPELKVGIEINGDYWHCDIYKDRMYHVNKTKLAASKGIRIIHIFEYEMLDEDKKEAIINMLKGLVSKNKTKIYAKELEIKEITNKESQELLNNYHLQGHINAEITLGAFYKSELIGVMSFKKSRFDTKYQYELLRLCWKNNFIVTGGTEKMLKVFIKSYNPLSIVTYSDNSKFEGNVYERIGFKYVNDSEPNYHWVGLSEHDSLSRYQTMKSKLADFSELGNTEKEIMEALNYVKIYDCGNKKFELIL